MRKVRTGFLFAIAAALRRGGALEVVATKDYEAAFEEFVEHYHKHYASPDERTARFAAFRASYDFAMSQNKEGNSFRLGLPEFADLTPQEFAMGFTQRGNSTGLLLAAAAPPSLGVLERTGAALPSDVDWRRHGAVTAVKNQGQCGGCWAFSATGATEGAWKIAAGQLISLSEQQLVDCAGQKYGDMGCKGGNPVNAGNYALDHGMCTEDSYRYDAKDGTCADNKCNVGIPKGGYTGTKGVTRGSDQALMEAVAQQPISVAVFASSQSFQLYKDGVASFPCAGQVDHAVLLAGYGTENGKDYWLVKNSWGPSWGEGGYMKLARNVEGYGQCSILFSPTFPVVNGNVRLWWYSVPWAIIFLAVAAGVACIGVSACLLKSKIAARRRPAEALAAAPQQALLFQGGGRTLAAPAAAPAQPPAAATAAASAAEGTRTGNSKSSRLLQTQAQQQTQASKISPV